VGPPAPVFVLSPAGRTFLVSVIAAAVLGSAIAVGVIALQNGYAHFQQTQSAQRIAALIDSGAAAYNSGDYARAATEFSQALEAGPNVAQRTIIYKNLAYTYVQQARAANGRGEWQTARDLYYKAINAYIDYDTPHRELAELLARHGDTRGAQDQRSAAPSPTAPDPTPTRLDNRLPAADSPAAVDGTPRQDPKQFVENQRAQARRLVDEGKLLLRQNRLDEAREKWQEAITTAPGTPERDEASQLLDNYPPPASDPGY
jgi:tetratricopeptide (TPR) repeat protein